MSDNKRKYLRNASDIPCRLDQSWAREVWKWTNGTGRMIPKGENTSPSLEHGVRKKLSVFFLGWRYYFRHALLFCRNVQESPCYCHISCTSIWNESVSLFILELECNTEEIISIAMKLMRNIRDSRKGKEEDRTKLSVLCFFFIMLDISRSSIIKNFLNSNQHLKVLRYRENH
jgi:hypothetical protein